MSCLLTHQAPHRTNTFRVLIVFCILLHLFSLPSGADSGLVAVWNMEPLRSEKAEDDEKIPKLLCSMTNHLCTYVVIIYCGMCIKLHQYNYYWRTLTKISL